VVAQLTVNQLVVSSNLTERAKFISVPNVLKKISFGTL
jgi:hypothetical protein